MNLPPLGGEGAALRSPRSSLSHKRTVLHALHALFRASTEGAVPNRRKGMLGTDKKKKYQGEFRVKKYVLENPSSEQFYCPEQHVKRCLTPTLCSPGALHRDRFQWAFTGISEEGLTALIPPNDPTLTLQVPWWKWFALPVPALTPCSAVLMSTGRGNHSISVA